MAAPRKSPAHLAAELQRLRKSNIDDRDRLSLIHEISVYQEELLVQNEALMRAQSALEEVRDQFIELFDFAPNGYVTLDEQGVITRCNLTAAAFFGRSRPSIEGLPLLGFVTPESRPAYFEFLRSGRTCQECDVEVEATLRVGDRTREVQLLCRPRAAQGSTTGFFTSIVDISEKRALERERARAADERGALAGHLLSALDDERRRIARDLHDDVGQQVTAIRLRLEHLTTTSTVSADWHPLKDMIARLDRQLHVVASELRPAALDLGLVTAAAQFVREWSKVHGISAEFIAHRVVDGSLPRDVETHMYRILQEGLSNVAKHAAAQHVSVLLENNRNEVVLLVEDDGRGFRTDERQTQRSGLGLVGMRERAAIVSGRLHLETAQGDGTSLYVYVPMHEKSSGQS